MKKQHRFYSSLILLIVLNAIIKPAWIFAIDRQVQNKVAVADYGEYFSLFNLSVVFVFLLDLGITVYFSRKLAIKDDEYLELSGSFLMIRILLVALYMIVVAIVALATGVTRWDIVLYTMLIQIFSSLLTFFRSIITAHQWFRADAWISVLDKTLMIILGGLLIYAPTVFGQLTIEKFLVLQFSCLAFAMFVSWIFLLIKGINFWPKRGWKPGWSLVRKAFPFGLIVLLMSAHWRIDGFLLERIKENGAYEAGVYAAAYRLLDAANMVGILLGAFLLPFIARLWSEQKSINDVVLYCRHFLVMFAIGVICLVLFLAPWIQQTLYHHQDVRSEDILRWCLLSLLGYALTQVYGTALTATGNITPFCYITALALVINITLNLILIPSLGAKGCCIAAVSSQFSGAILLIIFARKRLSLDAGNRSLVVYIFTAILLSVFLYAAKDRNISEPWLICIAALISLTILITSKTLGVGKLIFNRSAINN